MTLKEMKERRAAIYATEIDNAQNDAELDKLQTELRKLDLMIAEEERKAEDDRTAVVNGQVPGVVQASAQEQRKSVDENEMEYRKAFQQFVTKGTAIPAELRDDAVTATTDLTTAIPSVLVNRIVEKLETTGVILPLVSKEAFPAGMSIPTATINPVASWVAEGASSDRQKAEVKTAITFTHFKLRCEVAITKEASVMSLSAFETAFIKKVSKAMVKAIESAIVNGAYASDGTTLVGPKGILSETVATGQNVDIAADAGFAYQTFTDAEGKLPSEYEDGALWFMTKKTFMDIQGMVDDNGQPIARVNIGLGGKPERYINGRSVVTLPGDLIANYASTVDNDTVVAFIFKPDDYILNTNYDMGIQRKQDWDTEDYLTKAVMAVDGKVIDKNSLVTVTKKA